MTMEQQVYWSSEYTHGLTHQTSDHLHDRTVDFEDFKLHLPNQGYYQLEKPLPGGLIPNSIHGHRQFTAQAMPGLMLTCTPQDQDAASWHDSIREDDRQSLMTDSSGSSAINRRNSWDHQLVSAGQMQQFARFVPTHFHPSPPSPLEPASYYCKTVPAEAIIDPTLIHHNQDFGGLSEKHIKVEFEMHVPAYYEQPMEYEMHSPAESPIDMNLPYQQQPPTQQQQVISYPQQQHNGRHSQERVRTSAVTRSQKSASQSSHSSNHSRNSSASNASSKSSKSSTALLPMASKNKIVKRRESSSSASEHEAPNRNTGRPRKYNKKYSWFQCQFEGCTEGRFKNRSELKKHTETQHTKPYMCMFGCERKFGARNEWKRHIATQHLMLYRYHCDHPKCKDKPKLKSEFNRKDLFMKHLERMHAPKSIAEKQANDPEVIAWREEMNQYRARCEQLREPPHKMTCGFCTDVFENGDKTWMDFIDHVGVHFQQALPNITGEALPTVTDECKPDTTRTIQWLPDSDLMAWMQKEGLLGDGQVEPDEPRNTRRRSDSSSLSPSARQIKTEEQEY